jgi:predicted transposase/invertase (TIGR01784 family)
MAEEPVHQPHDKLFKAGFSDIPTAAELFRHYLPERISGELEWPTLKIELGTFIDEKLQGTESDLLYSVRTKASKQACFLYILFEHQRKEDHWLALRLLRYMISIWEQLLGKDPGVKKLPPIIPVVAGAERPALAMASALLRFAGHDCRPHF